MADAQPADDDKNPKNEPEEVKGEQVPSLDEVHDRTVNKIEGEEDNGEGAGEGGDEPAGDEPVDDDKGKKGDEPAGDEPAADDDDGAGGDDDQPGGGDDDLGEPDAGADEGAAQPEPTPAQPTPKLDTDIEKPGEGKVAIKNYDGKTYYFNNLDEVPEDFEPLNQTEAMRASKQFAKKEIEDEKIAEANAAAAERNAATQAVKDLREGWDTEVKTLTDNGVLPEDSKEREKVVNGVYEYMARRLNAGVIIDSWEEGYKGWQFEQQTKQDEADRKKESDAKKKRGGLVQPGGTPPPSGPKVIEGPPQGVSLDAVHDKALRDLNN